jgi:Fe2+ or Zn2+ uptake regulation protein
MPKYSKETRLKMIHDQIEHLRVNPNKTTKKRIAMALLILQGKTHSEIEDIFGYHFCEDLK